MTRAQLDLISVAVQGVRRAQKSANSDDELIEVGVINGVDPRTANSLVRLDILEDGFPKHRNCLPRSKFVRLKTCTEQ